MTDNLYFICPWCGWANNRDAEGLDECDKCHSELATRCVAFDNQLAVKWARQPAKPLSALSASQNRTTDNPASDSVVTDHPDAGYWIYENR